RELNSPLGLCVAGRVDLMPPGLRKLRQKFLKLGLQGRRNDFSGENAQACPFTRPKNIQLRSDRGEELRPTAQSTPMHQHARTLRIVHVEHAGLGIDAGPSAADGMQLIPFDLGRAPLMGFHDKPERPSRVWESRCKKERNARSKILRSLDI